MTATIEENASRMSADNSGRIARVIGPVVDVEFPVDAMPDIYNKLEVNLELGGEERVVTIMMSDLRGFSALAARLTPHQVIEFLNLYLESMVEVITRYGGTIDEIIGDAILVIFGAPVASGDHAAKAVACALDMQLAMAEVNRRLAAAGRAGGQYRRHAAAADQPRPALHHAPRAQSRWRAGRA